MEPVVTVLVVPAPLGFTIVNVTDAPDAALPPTVTVADMLTVARAAKGPAMGERDVTGGTITFAVAEDEPVFAPRVAEAEMELLPAPALVGIPTVSVLLDVAPGAMLGAAVVNVPVQPEGTMLLRLNVLATQPVVSLFFTLTV